MADDVVDDLRLVALTPAQMVPAQTELIAWCEKKAEAVQAEYTDLETNLQIATERGWKYESVARSLERTRKRVTYYQKMKAALEAGYLLVPNLPCDVFAVRVQRTKQPEKVSEYKYNLGYKTAHAQLLPAGEGRYVDETLFTNDESYVETVDGKEKRVSRWTSGDYDEVDFPVMAVKPAVLEATARAMALKVFDEMGLVTNESGRDPIVVGRLTDPRGNRRRATFFVAWWLDTVSL